MRARSWTLARVGEADFESIFRTKFRFRLSDEGEYYRESVSRARGDKRGPWFNAIAWKIVWKRINLEYIWNVVLWVKGLVDDRLLLNCAPHARSGCQRAEARIPCSDVVHSKLAATIPDLISNFQLSRFVAGDWRGPCNERHLIKPSV